MRPDTLGPGAIYRRLSPCWRTANRGRRGHATDPESRKLALSRNTAHNTTAHDSMAPPACRIAVLALPYVVPHWLTEDLAREPAVSVLPHASLEEILQTLRTEPVSLMFAQISLLDSGAGIDPALRLLRKTAADAGNRLRIVLLTDSASDNRLLQAFYANVTDFIELPLDAAAVRRFTAEASAVGNQPLPVKEAPTLGRLCVVNNDWAVTAHLRSILAVRGYRIDQFDSGEAALAAIQKQAYEAVLVTRHLAPAGMDGTSSIERLRGLESGNHQLPILAITRSQNEALLGQLYAAGANDHISTIASARELVTRISNLAHHTPQAGAPDTDAHALQASEAVVDNKTSPAQPAATPAPAETRGGASPLRRYRWLILLLCVTLAAAAFYGTRDPGYSFDYGIFPGGDDIHRAGD